MYVSRPVISPTVGSIMPQTYDNGVMDPTAGLGPTVRVAPNVSLSQNSGGFGGGGQQAGIGGQQGGFGAAGGANSGGIGNTGGGSPAAPPANPMNDFTQGVAALAEAGKIGEMFHFTVDKVTLPRQQSSMIPIIAEGVTVDRVSIYSPGTSGKYALRGVRLYNKTGKFLLGGPVTVIDVVKEGTSYAGDAKLGDVPDGQSRLLAYAVDQDVMIQSKDAGDEALLSGKLQHGVFLLNYRSQIARDYTLQNKSDEAKTIVLEHPLTDGYDLKEPAKPLETTEHAYRFDVKLAAKETKSFKVLVEQVRTETVALAGENDEALMLYMKQGAISPKVKEASHAIAARRAALADVAHKIAIRVADRAQLMKDEANTRENIRTLPEKSKSQEDAINKLTGQEDQMQQLDLELKKLNASADEAKAEFEKYLEDLSVE